MMVNNVTWILYFGGFLWAEMSGQLYSLMFGQTMDDKGWKLFF